MNLFVARFRYLSIRANMNGAFGDLMHVSIGVCAFNEERNMDDCLTSISEQKEDGFRIKRS